MSWMGPWAKRALKYGPYVQQAWKHAGKPTQQALRKSAASWSSRRTALQHADTVRRGSVLRVMHEGGWVWVVYSGDQPVASYPTVAVPLSDLVAHADLDKRVTPGELRERQRARELRRVAGERAIAFRQAAAKRPLPRRAQRRGGGGTRPSGEERAGD